MTRKGWSGRSQQVYSGLIWEEARKPNSPHVTAFFHHTALPGPFFDRLILATYMQVVPQGYRIICCICLFRSPVPSLVSLRS